MRLLIRAFTKKVRIMLKEGEVRIPSGCAISGIFSRSGQLVNGEKIITSIATMHDRSNGLGGGLQVTGYIRNTRTITHFIFSMMTTI